MTLTLSSPAFRHNSEIPTKYTCDSTNISPALQWSDMPQETKSLVLIVDDPDAPDPAAPRATWVHWVLYNLPPSVSSIKEGASQGNLPPGTSAGMNDWKHTSYGGPCPPFGRHRFFFKLYALDTVLPDLKSPTKTKVEAAMQGHVIEHAELIGTYQH